MKKLTVISLSIIAFLGLSSMKDDLTFNDFDKNDNGLIARSEFVLKFTKNYVNDLDNKDDKHLDDENFYHVTYDVWDADNDNMLDEEEYINGFDYYYGDYVMVDFATVDVDNDGFVEYAEYYEIVEPTSWFDDWDLDNSKHLNEHELARGVFNYWDFDNSNFIELDEFIEFDTYYLDI